MAFQKCVLCYRRMRKAEEIELAYRKLKKLFGAFCAVFLIRAMGVARHRLLTTPVSMAMALSRPIHLLHSRFHVHAACCRMSDATDALELQLRVYSRLHPNRK